MTRWLFPLLACAALLCSWSTALHAQQGLSPNRPPSKPVSRVDLNGIWEGVTGPPGSPGNHGIYRLLVYQLRNTIQLYNFEGYPFLRPGIQLMTTDQPVPATLPVRITADIRSVDEKGKLWWYHSALWIDSPDDIRILDIHKLHRTKRLDVADVPCDPGNPTHVSGVDAFRRGNAYYLMHDLPTANCWYHAGAVEGDGDAQSSYAYSLLRGRGIPQDVKEAKVWAQRSAEQHNPFGEYNLATLIATAKASNLWEAIKGGLAFGIADEMMRRYNLHDPNVAYQGDPTAPVEPAVPTFEEDSDYRFDLSGEFRVHLPEPAPRPSTFAVVARQKETDFQLIVVEPNTVYPLGESMFNGHYTGGRIEGDLMDAPARQGGGYRGFAWMKAELKIVNLNELELPGGWKLTRTRGFAGANRPCAAAGDRYLDAGRALHFAGVDYTLKNYGATACWLYIAGIQGRPEAALALGLFYRMGIGVKKDDAQSFIWVRRAADADIDEADELLAQYYEQGIGTKKSPELAQLRRAGIKRRLEILRLQAEHDAKEEQENEKEAQSMIGLIGMLGIPLNPFKEDLIQAKMAEGKTRDQATRLVEMESNNDWFTQFVGDIISGKGYQAPPMPPEPK